MAQSTNDERRRADRKDLGRPAKVFHRGSWRYVAAFTRNISDTGVLVEIMDPRTLEVGDIVDVAVGWTGGPVLRSDEFVNAKVVRVTMDPKQGQVAACELVRPLAA